MEGGSRRAIIAAFLANLGIAVAKFAGFVVTSSASMLAEAVHSVADTSNQGLLLLGGRRARRPPTAKHPFGHGRERYFWSFVVALVIFSLGALFAILEGAEKMWHPPEVESPMVAVVILAVAVGLESLSLRTAVREARPLRAGASWWEFVRRSKQPELPVVLLEDLGALLGLLFALAGVLLADATGNSRFDALGSLTIGLVLAAIAVTLMREMKSLLMGESASEPTEDAIRSAVEAHPRVRRVIHMRTQHLGPDELLVGAKVEFEGVFSDAESLAHTIDDVERRLRDAVPAARVVYLEPDVLRRS
jgi:cation diffusion facilitator family transporter